MSKIVSKSGKSVLLYWAVAGVFFVALLALPRPSESQMIPLPGGPYATFQGVVTSAHGPAPTYPGASCTVSATPSSGTYNCRIQVTCGGMMIYGSGSSGYNHCQIRAGVGAMPTAEAHDRGYSYSDGDPRMDAYLPSGPVTVSDRVGPVTWQVTVSSLSPIY